jgi:hypothetical protein
VLGSPKLLVHTVARGVLCVTLGGCMTLAPQLEPTDFARVEQAQTRGERDRALRDNTIYRHQEPQGTRYTKGNVDGTPKRSWQSLDVILRSDENSSAALPAKQLRRSRVFTALAIASSILFVAGVAATARDGFDFKKPSGGNAVLLGGALGSVAFAVVAGILYRRSARGYDRAVDVYNDSLGLRLGVMTPEGGYIPPPDVMVDKDGFVITEDRLAPGAEGPAIAPTIAPPLAPTSAPPPPVSAPPLAPAPVTTPAPEVQPVPAPPVPAPPRQALTAPSSRVVAPGLLHPRRLAPVGALTLLPQR